MKYEAQLVHAENAIIGKNICFYQASPAFLRATKIFTVKEDFTNNFKLTPKNIAEWPQDAISAAINGKLAEWVTGGIKTYQYIVSFFEDNGEEFIDSCEIIKIDFEKYPDGFGWCYGEIHHTLKMI